MQKRLFKKILLKNRRGSTSILGRLQTPTIPIVDAIHKMGRQTLAFAQMGFYYYTVQQHGVDAITPELVAGVSGAASIYTLVKGKGK